ncbi:MAG: TonB-dependent receptor [Gammaproteobacteria bacterium]|nr:TonB-dependent receptor [Gammaproteobacteria bacterium]
MLKPLFSIVVAGLLCAPLAAFGQDADEEGEGQRTGRQIEEVVVTAERRESTVQDTAISITAFTGEFIEDFGLRNQEDLQNYLPATTIQPYDLSVRGVGRLYRALGGDPGVATYFDGAYSEDFGIASTEGGLFDLERIEVLRGPQGTLYGRNGLGGAVNFHSKRPSGEFEGEFKGIYGGYDTREVFGMLTGPIIKEVLNARVTGVKRTRDGFVKEYGDGPDLNSYGDENYTLALEWMPTENLTVYVRGNERSYRREMSGAQGAGAIIVSEMGGMPDPVNGGERWTSLPQIGWRAVQDPNDPNSAMCASATDRSVPDCIMPVGLVPYINGTAAGSMPGTGVYRFNYDGNVRYAQPIVAGVDATGDTSVYENSAYQAFGNPALISILNETTVGPGDRLTKLDGDDLKTYTNGFNDEFFDHQAAYASVEWNVNENLSLKYIGAYTDYFYDRTTEHDRTGLPHDRQFYAAQENENSQHELQMFLDIGESVTLTGGAFYYKNDIDQQLDFYSTDGWSKYTDDQSTGGNYYNGLNPDVWMAGFAGALGIPYQSEMINHRSAQQYAAQLDGGAENDYRVADGLVISPWMGDNFQNTGRVDHGPVSDGTTFIWDTENRTTAQAIYLQGEWQMNEQFALTLGVRWAEDDKEAEENLFLYSEAIADGLGMLPAVICSAVTDDSVACGDDPNSPDGVVTLAEYNQNVTGALDETGNLVNYDSLRAEGVPYALGIYRAMERTFDDITWRVNVDYTPTEKDLLYFSVTTGYRAGGFNLGYYSPTPNYDNESITAYELGYKGQILDGTMQINASAYYYDYDNIALQFYESGLAGAGTSVINAPAAETLGLELDLLWLVTDNLTLGGTYSYADATYKGDAPVDQQVVDRNNPYAPEGIPASPVYTLEELKVPIDGEPLPRVPKHKATIWAEYTQQLGNAGKVIYLTSVNWTGEFPAAGRPLRDGPLVTAPEFARWDGRVSWTSASEQWNVSGFVNNILDDVGVRNMFTYGMWNGYRRAIEPTNPRMWGLEVQYKFGAFQ